MNSIEKVELILVEIDELFEFVHNLISEKELILDDQYKKINHTYFNLFSTHFESMLILIQNGHFSSAILLMRAMLEIFVKSFYFEFIEKTRGGTVEGLISKEKDFPNFFLMVKALEEYKHDSYGEFKGFFIQFTKSGLASYEKYSLFSHGRGEVLRAFYNNDRISYTDEQISDVVLSAKGLYEQLSLLLFFTQQRNDEIGRLLEKIKA